MTIFFIFGGYVIMRVNILCIQKLMEEEKRGIVQTKNIIEYVDNITKNIKNYNTENDIVILSRLKMLCKRKLMSEEIAKMTRNIGMYHFYRNDTKKASRYLNESIRIAKEQKLQNLLVAFLSDKGLLSFYDLKYKTAKRLYLQAFELMMYIDNLDKRMQHLLYYRTGILYSYMSSYANSYEMFNKALKFAELITDKGWAMVNIGVNYERQGLYNEALEEYNKVLEFYGESYAIERSSIYNNIAEVYKEVGKYEIALDNINKAFELLECKNIGKFFIFFQTYAEIKVLQGESKEELEKLIELISQVKDFFVYKCFIIDGLNIAVKTSTNDKVILSKLSQEIAIIINEISQENNEYKSELNNLMSDIYLSLRVLSSE
jgi:tetratricopeptide (TPR) repeat protein